MTPNPACCFYIEYKKKKVSWVFDTLSEAKAHLKVLLQDSPEVSRGILMVGNHESRETITCEDGTTIYMLIIKGLKFDNIQAAPDKRIDPKKREFTPDIKKKVYNFKTFVEEPTKEDIDNLVDLPEVVEGLGITPKRARRLLKRGGIQKPRSGWSWPQGKDVEDVRKCLIELIEKYPQKGEDNDDTETDAVSDS
jgi:hypothetical protein